MGTPQRMWLMWVNYLYMCRKVKDHQQIQGRNFIGRSSIRTSCGICAIHRHCKNQESDVFTLAAMWTLLGCPAYLPADPAPTVPATHTHTHTILIHAAHYIGVVLHGNVWKCMIHVHVCIYACIWKLACIWKTHDEYCSSMVCKVQMHLCACTCVCLCICMHVHLCVSVCVFVFVHVCAYL